MGSRKSKAVIRKACYLGFAMINSPTSFEVCIYYLYEDGKDNAEWEYVVAMDQSGSLNIAQFSNASEFLLVFYYNIPRAGAGA